MVGGREMETPAATTCHGAKQEVGLTSPRNNKASVVIPGPRSFCVKVVVEGCERPPKPEVVAIIDPDQVPKVGSLVLMRLKVDECPSARYLARFEGGDGRDIRGKFCRRGDPQERFSIGSLAYTRMDVDRGVVTILGTVAGWSKV